MLTTMRGGAQKKVDPCCAPPRAHYVIKRIVWDAGVSHLNEALVHFDGR